ncbi:MAG: hypothetical protein PHY15_02040 [Eubacteriales bacterium]|nr:hypothetical protein [Eubacteriales bacterium]MDD4475629.1 hypothetical protein [Eubacteriales bacterium]
MADIKTQANKIFTSPVDCKRKLGRYFNTYLSENADEIADIESLADFLGCTRRELLTLEKDDVYGPFVSRAKNSIARIKKQMAMKGKIPAAVLSFDMKNNHDYSDKGDSSESETPVIVISGDALHWCD